MMATINLGGEGKQVTITINGTDAGVAAYVPDLVQFTNAWVLERKKLGRKPPEPTPVDCGCGCA